MVSQYIPYFVRTYGWFENAESIFIAMEYFPLGDLRRSMITRPPFLEEEASQIVKQLVEGMKFMHGSGYAHRDLKPAVRSSGTCTKYMDQTRSLVRPYLLYLPDEHQNILVTSRDPRWLVKIADFGISKQAVEGGTNLHTTNIGTFGYMAPEVHGFLAGNDASVAYSVSVDMWAIGVIALELLLQRHPFPNMAEYVSHVTGVKCLDFRDFGLTEPCRDLVGGLLSPNPIIRPSASAAASHPWLQEIPDSEDSDDE